MNRSAFSDVNAGTQVGLIILVTLASFLLSLLLAGVLSVPLFGVSLGQLQQADFLTSPAGINVSKFFQIMQSIGLFVVPPLVLGRIFERNSFRFLRIDRRPSSRRLLLAICIPVLAIPAINLIAYLNTQIRFPDSMGTLENMLKHSEKNIEQLTTAFLNVQTVGGLLVNLFMIALLPAIGEEFFFRGLLQRMIAGWTKNHHVAILITGFVFSAIHMQFYGFFPRWLLGILLGYLFVWSGNLWLPIIAHFINNAIAVLGYFLISRQSIPERTMNYGASTDASSLLITLLFTAATGLMIYAFYRTKTTMGERAED